MARLIDLGRWSASVAAIPGDVRRAARAQVLDMVAAAHASARTGIARPVVDAVAATASPGRATSLADGARLAPVDAAIVNTALSMAHDYDDIVWMGHTCHSAVFAAVAAGEHLGASVDEVIDAVVVANELAGRLGASSLLGPLNGQMWTFIHLVGAAAAAARLLRLDAERTTHALAIALAQPNFALQPGFLRPTSKLLAAATPTATGLRAAFFAQAGMTGAADILEDERGFWARFAFRPMPGMLDDLGDLWVLRTLAIKTYPGCHYFQTALTAVERILARRPDLARERVKAVRVESTKLGCEATRFAGDYVEGADWTPVGVNFDLAQSVAVMLVARRLGVEELEEAWLREHGEALRAWYAITTVQHDPALTARTIACARHIGAGRAAMRSLRPRDLITLARRYRAEYRSRLASPREVLGLARALSRRRRGGAGAAANGAIALDFANRVRIEMTDGTHEEERVDTPEGALASPGFEGALEAKALREIAPSLGEQGARRAIDRTWSAAGEPVTGLVETWTAGVTATRR